MAYVKRDELVGKLIAAGHNTGALESFSRAELLRMVEESSTILPQQANPIEQVIVTNVGTGSNSVDSTEVTIITNATNTTSQPNPVRLKTTDPGWTDYVKSFLQPNELIEGFPTCDGLRRVFELLMGEIDSITAKVVESPKVQNLNRATVEVTISYAPLNNPLGYKTITDVADVYNGNTKPPFCNYPTATAATMAEGRCLRKGLRLVKVLTREEMESPDAIDQEIGNMAVGATLITSSQQNIVKTLCERHNIDITKLLNSIPETKDQVLEGLSYTNTQLIMRLLSDYARGPDNKGKVIPEGILKGVVVQLEENK